MHARKRIGTNSEIREIGKNLLFKFEANIQGFFITYFF